MSGVNASRWSRSYVVRLSGPLSVFALLICLTYVVYAVAFDAPFQFDDAPSLSGLANVNDLNSAIRYVYGGVASSVGRPLANASFLLNRSDWPDNPGGFRLLGTLVHLVNAILLALLVRAVAGLHLALDAKRATWMAVVVASAWALHPLLASTTLMPVQRMTAIAGTFSLLGLIGYVHGRGLLAAGRTTHAYVWMSLSLFAGSAVGVLAKESAALLPLLAGVLEWTLLRHLPVSGSRRFFRVWKYLFFLAPMGLLVAYVLMTWAGHTATYQAREFSMSERLSTQLIVMWTYARQLILPDVRLLTPYFDAHPIYDYSDIKVLIAATAWAAVALFAFFMRGVTPLPLFALGWFWSGHLLESTVLPLELYFEHRNYIPSIGLISLLAAPMTVSNLAVIRRLAVFIPLILALLLWRVTSLWADHGLAAEMWKINQPQSVRATFTLASHYMKIGFRPAGERLIEEAWQEQPRNSAFAFAALHQACYRESSDEIRERYARLIELAPMMSNTIAMTESLDGVSGLVIAGECPGLEVDMMLALYSALLAGEKTSASAVTRNHLNHHVAKLYQHQGLHAEAAERLWLAFLAMPNPNSAALASAEWFQAGDLDRALTLLEDALTYAPHNRVKRQGWEVQLNSLHAALEQVRSELREGGLGSGNGVETGGAHR